MCIMCLPPSPNKYSAQENTFYIKGREGLIQCLVLACVNVAAANMSDGDNNIERAKKRKDNCDIQWGSKKMTS